MKKIALIIGSNRSQRVALSIGKWVLNQLQSEDFTVDMIDLADINLPWLDEPEIPAKGNYQLESTQKWSEIVAGYDGFIMLYPQYNWGYPAVLKNALDSLYAEWHNKPVSLISYGSHGGFQGMQAMRWVLAGLKMKQLATQVGLIMADDMVNEAGQFIDIEAALASQAFNLDLLRQNFEQELNVK